MRLGRFRNADLSAVFQGEGCPVTITFDQKTADLMKTTHSQRAEAPIIDSGRAKDRNWAHKRASYSTRQIFVIATIKS